MSANTRFKEDEDRMHSQQGKHKESKIQHQQHSVPNGQTTLWSFEENKPDHYQFICVQIYNGIF